MIHMIKITPNQCYFRHLQMFHDDTHIPVNQLGPNDEIEGKKLGYSPAQHKNLSGLINNKYFADVEAKTDREEVGTKKTIATLSSYTWTKIPAAHKAQ
jgi:hypothetical protein